MEAIVIPAHQLKAITETILQLQRQLNNIDLNNTAEMKVPVVEHDALCYIQRYRDLKKVVEGKPIEFKIDWARRHYNRFGKNENRVWGCVEELPPSTSDKIPHVNSAPAGFLWKPVSDSRGGIPALLTPSSWAQVTPVLLDASGTSPIKNTLEKRGKTNPDKETYFFHGVRASMLPKNMILDLGQYGKFLVPDPTLRYD